MAYFEIALECEQNRDFSWTWGFASGTIANNTPFNFTGASAVFQINETSATTSANLLRLTSSAGQITFGTAVVQGVTVATITITIPNATTVNLPAGDWYYDLLVIQSGQQQYYAKGAFRVKATASR